VAIAATGPRAVAVVASVVVMVTGLFALRTLDRIPVWRDNDTFFLQMEQDAPRSFRISWLAAQQSLVLGDSARAEALMREAVEQNPYNPELAEELGHFLMGKDRHGAAIPLFIQALDRELERRASLQGLTISLIRTGRGVEALRWLAWLEELHGSEPLLVVLRVEALREAGRYRESLEVAQEALRERPRDWNLRLLAAQSASRAGLCDTALRHLEEGEPQAPESRRDDFDQVRRSIEAGEVPCA
jgi:predicted Zn-dependent protease